MKKMEKKYRAPFSFRQCQDFRNNNGNMDFSLFCHKTDNYKNQKNLKLKGKLTKNSKLRNLEEMPLTVNIDCSSSSTNSNPVKFGCKLMGDPQADGIIIYDSDEVTGIPTIKEIANPANVDDLIKSGEAKECNSKDCSLPTFSSGKLKESYYDKGILNIDGEINGNINDGEVFNLSYGPESYGDCEINTTSKNIECYNKEEIEDNKIIIPETIVRDKNNKELFLFKRVASRSNGIYSPINNNLHLEANPVTIESTTPSSSDTVTIPSDSTNSDQTSPSDNIQTTSITSETIDTSIISDSSQEQNDTIISISHFSRSKSSGKISGGAIAGIVIAIAFVIILATVLIILFKSGKIGGKKAVVNETTLENSSNLATSISKFHVPA